jgi:hypothetical protein
MCKAAPWQGSGNPYAHVHDASKVDEYKDWIEDNEARDAWILKNGGTDTFPAGSGGFFWCNEKNGAWVQSKDLPNCPHADVKGAWKATADGYNGQDLIINGEPVKTWTTDCVTYFKTGKHLSKPDAKKFCQDNGLELAQQRNEEELKLLRGEGTFWMGAVRSDADAHQWVWGEPDSTTDVDCLFWQPGEPNNPHGEKCLHGNWGDGWNDRTCGGGDGVICEKRTCVPSCDHLRVNGREVEGIKSDCVTYFKTDKKMKKADAKQFCLDHGLKLATQKNNVEHDLMKDNGKSFWLDGTRSNSDVHQWVWGEADSPVDISKFGCFFWQSGQPDHYGDNEDCMHVLTSGLWNDIRCDASYYVTCELRTCEGVCDNDPPISEKYNDQEDPAGNCYRDTGNRDLEYYLTTSMPAGVQSWPAWCREECKKKGYLYAAVQYSTHCFCDNDYGKYGKRDISDCNMNCNDIEKNKCGGPWGNNVYRTGLE